MAALRIFLAASALALPLWVAATTPAQACTCGGPDFQEVVRLRHPGLVIVIGVAGEVQMLNPPPTRPPLSPPDVQYLPYVIGQAEVEWSLAVEEYIIGSGPVALAVRSTTSVEVGSDDRLTIRPGTTTLCGFSPQPGARYVFFLGRHADGTYGSGACSFNMLITAATEANVQAFVAQIRAILASPTPQPTSLPPLGTHPPQRDGSSMAPLIIAAVAGVALASAALLLGRRRES